MTAIELIQAERTRQIEKLGWTSEHDDQHTNFQLSAAGSCYANPYNGGPYSNPNYGYPPQDWPWDASWWSPSEEPIRNLVKAGALIVAEIERLQRAEIN